MSKYVIEKIGYNTTVVSLTKQEAQAIINFLDWACVDEEFAIIPVDEYEAKEWGHEQA